MAKCNLDELRELLADEGIHVPEDLSDPEDFLNHLHTALLTAARMAQRTEDEEEEEDDLTNPADLDNPPVLMSHGLFRVPKRRRRRRQTPEETAQAVDGFFKMLPGREKGRDA